MARYEVEVAIYHMVTIEAVDEDEASEKGQALAEAGEGRNGYVEVTYVNAVGAAEAA